MRTSSFTGRIPAAVGRLSKPRAGLEQALGRLEIGQQVENLPHWRRGLALGIAVLALLGTVACRQDMHDQPKYIPLRPTEFFPDKRSERPLIEGTVSRGNLNEDAALYTGMGPDGKPLDAFPFPVTKEVIERGHARFDIYCSPCHGRLGNGDGMLPRRGFRQPPSYHNDRLRKIQNGYIFDVITHGFGSMPDYAAQIPVRDRWAIVSYVRALQMSQNMPVSELAPEDRAKLPGGAR